MRIGTPTSFAALHAGCPAAVCLLCLCPAIRAIMRSSHRAACHRIHHAMPAVLVACAAAAFTTTTHEIH
jgi:hypothetical protein